MKNLKSKKFFIMCHIVENDLRHANNNPWEEINLFLSTQAFKSSFHFLSFSKSSSASQKALISTWTTKEKSKLTFCIIHLVETLDAQLFIAIGTIRFFPHHWLAWKNYLSVDWLWWHCDTDFPRPSSLYSFVLFSNYMHLSGWLKPKWQPSISRRSVAEGSLPFAVSTLHRCLYTAALWN